MNHAELKAKALSNSETLTAYESMEVEFSLLRQMLAAHEKAGLSQPARCELEIKLVKSKNL